MKQGPVTSEKSVSIFKDSSVQDNILPTVFDNPYWFGVMDEFGGIQANLDSDLGSNGDSKPRIRVDRMETEPDEFNVTFRGVNSKQKYSHSSGKLGKSNANHNQSDGTEPHLASQATEAQHLNSKHSDLRYKTDKSNDADSVINQNKSTRDKRFDYMRDRYLGLTRESDTPSRKHSFFNSSSVVEERSRLGTDRHNPVHVLLEQRRRNDLSRKRLARDLQESNKISRLLSQSQDSITQKYQELQARVDRVAEIDARAEDLGYRESSLPHMNKQKQRLKKVLRGGSIIYADADDDVLGEKHLMNSQPIILKDREEVSFRLGDKSYIKGCFDSHHRLLPLRIEIESSYIFFELFLEFNAYPSFSTPVIKSTDNVTVVGLRYQKQLTDDRSLRFCLYSHRACSVKIYVEFSLVKPREVDLGATKMERLLNFKPFLEFKLREGRVAEKARMQAQSKKLAKEQIRHKIAEEEDRIEYESFIKKVTVVGTARNPLSADRKVSPRHGIAPEDFGEDLPEDSGKEAGNEDGQPTEAERVDFSKLGFNFMQTSPQEGTLQADVPDVTIMALKGDENENDIPALPLLRLVSEIDMESRKRSMRSITGHDSSLEEIEEHENIKQIRQLLPKSGINIGEVNVKGLPESELIKLIKDALHQKKGPPVVKGLSMFFSKKKGLKEYIHSQNIKLQKQVEEARVRKEQLYEEERARMFEDIERRNKKPPSQLEMLTVVTTKMLKIAKQQILTKFFLMCWIVLGVRKHLKKERFEVDLYIFFSMVRKIGVLKNFSAKTYKPKPLGVVCDVQHALRLRGILGLDQIVIKNAKNVIGHMLNKIYFVNTLRGSLLHTNTILKTILHKLRLHKQLNHKYQVEIQNLVGEKLETLLFLENDSDVTLNNLRKLVETHILDLVFVFFNMRLSEFLRNKIDKIIKESGSRKEARKQKNVMNLLMGIKTSDYAKEGLDMLARVRSFPVTDRKCRSSEMYPVYEEFSKNQKSIPLFRQWLSDKNPLKKPPESSIAKKLKPQLTRGFSSYQDHLGKEFGNSNPSLTSIGALERQQTIMMDPLGTQRELPPVMEEEMEMTQLVRGDTQPISIKELKIPLQTPRQDTTGELLSSRSPPPAAGTPGTVSALTTASRKKKTLNKEGFKLDLTDNMISCLVFSLWKFFKTKSTGSTGMARRVRF